MKVLDCNIFYGATPNGKPYKNCDTFAELCSAMRNSGIDGGLIRCGYSTTVGVVYGNNMVAADVNSKQAADFSMWGVWNIIPPHTNEIPSPEKLPEEMAKNKIAALYLNPKEQRFVPNRISIGAYLKMAEERKIPVILNTCHGLTMAQIGDIMEMYPKLTAIVGDTDCWPNARRLYPLAYSYENLYLDLSYVMDDQGVEDMTRRFGADRILFGTSFPERYTGSVMAMVRAAEISEEDRAKIFGGNLERLIGQEVLK